MGNRKKFLRFTENFICIAQAIRFKLHDKIVFFCTNLYTTYLKNKIKVIEQRCHFSPWFPKLHHINKMLMEIYNVKISEKSVNQHIEIGI